MVDQGAESHGHTSIHAIEELNGLNGAPVALTVGFFDGGASGTSAPAVRLNQQAARLSALSLAVTFSNSPRGFHNPREALALPSTLPDEKLELLAAQGLAATLLLRYERKHCGPGC